MSRMRPTQRRWLMFYFVIARARSDQPDNYIRYGARQVAVRLHSHGYRSGRHEYCARHCCPMFSPSRHFQVENEHIPQMGAQSHLLAWHIV
jgi:hypothetical protein